MIFRKCPDCGFEKNLTKHSLIVGHAEGHGYALVCRDCHDKIHNCENKRKNTRSQKGSNGKFAKGTRRKK